MENPIGHKIHPIGLMNCPVEHKIVQLDPESNWTIILLDPNYNEIDLEMSSTTSILKQSCAVFFVIIAIRTAESKSELDSESTRVKFDIFRRLLLSCLETEYVFNFWFNWLNKKPSFDLFLEIIKLERSVCFLILECCMTGPPRLACVRTGQCPNGYPNGHLIGSFWMSYWIS